MLPQQSKESALLYAAYNDGIVSAGAVLPSLSKKDRAYFVHLDLRERSQPKTRDKRPAAHMAAQNTIDSTRGRVKVNFASVGTIEELARVLVPARFIGVVKQLGQYVQIGKDITTEANDWGKPWNAADKGVLLRWHLRLDGTNPGSWLSAPSPKHLPGLPYPKLASWDDLRFAWGLDQEIQFLIRQGFTLRMFVEVLAADTQRRGRVAGRLTGFIQDTNAFRAEWNARRGW